MRRAYSELVPDLAIDYEAVIANLDLACDGLLVTVDTNSPNL
jgi:hypothetical protein